MIPILFEANETAFADNGIGRLRDCLSCIVTEERNGIYECDFEYPVNGANYDKIICGRIVGVTHDETGDIQPFTIVSYSKPINGIVSFHCTHISYRQSQMTVAGTQISSLADAFTMLGNATPTNPFTYETDITSSAYMAAADGTPRSVRQMLGGVQGSILDAYGGEFEWDKFRVILHSARGQMRDFAIRYGVNLLDYNDDTDYQSTFTSCIPFYNGDSLLVGNQVTLGTTGFNGYDICVPLDLTDKFESEPTTAQLEAKALSYMQSNQTNLPAQSISVDFVRLADMGEFSAFQDLLKCSLCDTITVIFPMYNVSANFKIVKTIWNVLRGSYEGMELGTLATTLSEALGIGESFGSSSGSGGGSGLDYITEEGTEGIWTYRVWASGVAECWGTLEESITGWTAWGSLYEGTASTHTATYPNGLFSSAPDFFANSKGTSQGILVETYGAGSSTTTPQVYAVRPNNSGSTGTYKFSLYAVGGGSMTRDVNLMQSGDVLILT